MKGIQKIHIENTKASFDFELHRNITVVRGNSASGKSTLYNMVDDYSRRAEQSGIKISSTRPCHTILGLDWESEIKQYQNSIIFFDEGAKYLSSKAFSRAIQQTDNYYVLFTRENLFELPYSINEIYEVAMVGRSRKKHCLKHVYELDQHYWLKNRFSRADNKTFDILITEDSNSGYEFFRACFDQSKINCESAGSKTSIYEWLDKHVGENIFVIADGAAFGPEIDGITKWQAEHPECSIICLSESFEWLLLKSGVIPNDSINEMLQHPEDFIESKEFSSWERFFTKYLEDISKGKPYEYTKKKINPYYTAKANSEKVLGLIAL